MTIFKSVIILFILLLTACQSTVIYNTSGVQTKTNKQVTQPKSTVSTGENSGYMVASWYGHKFHGRKTANGEIYNMYDYTAAHRTLPFGTRLRLINEENNKSVIVRINDRGPVPVERDIDVSYKTAQTLGFVNQGLSRLKVIYLD